MAAMAAMAAGTAARVGIPVLKGAFNFVKDNVKHEAKDAFQEAKKQTKQVIQQGVSDLKSQLHFGSNDELQLYRYLEMLETNRKPYYEYDFMAYSAIVSFFNEPECNYFIDILVNDGDGEEIKDFPEHDVFDARELLHENRVLMHECIRKKFKRSLVKRDTHAHDICNTDGTIDELYFERMFENLKSFTAFPVTGKNHTYPCFVYRFNNETYLYEFGSIRDFDVRDVCHPYVGRIATCYRFTKPFRFSARDTCAEHGFHIATTYFMIDFVFSVLGKDTYRPDEFNEVLSQCFEYFHFLQTNGAFEHVIQNYIYTCMLHHHANSYECSVRNIKSAVQYVNLTLKQKLLPTFIKIGQNLFVPRITTIPVRYTDIETVLKTFSITFVPFLKHTNENVVFSESPTCFMRFDAS
jgi:hypothetical protein